jgi:hypothetical protein
MSSKSFLSFFFTVCPPPPAPSLSPLSPSDPARLAWESALRGGGEKADGEGERGRRRRRREEEGEGWVLGTGQRVLGTGERVRKSRGGVEERAQPRKLDRKKKIPRKKNKKN